MPVRVRPFVGYRVPTTPRVVGAHLLNLLKGTRTGKPTLLAQTSSRRPRSKMVMIVGESSVSVERLSHRSTLPSVEALRPTCCPYCGHVAQQPSKLGVVGHGTYTRQVLGLISRSRQLMIWVRRYLCRGCQKTISVLPDALSPPPVVEPSRRSTPPPLRSGVMPGFRWCRKSSCCGAFAGWPRVVTHPRLPQIRTCGFPASGSSESWVRCATVNGVDHSRRR